MKTLLATFDAVTEADWSKLATTVLQLQPNTRVFVLEGAMGAGKTTFVKALCRALGSKDDFSSPTYAIVNEYQTDSGNPIYHMDLYRLQDETEVLNAGIEEYLTSNQYCFVEWYQLAQNLLPDEYVTIEIAGEGNTRKISIFGTS